MEKIIEGEWSTKDWLNGWTINVGRAYCCKKCSSILMVTKGGIGNLEPICCKQMMEILSPVQTEKK
jgi:hypothetical protein